MYIIILSESCSLHMDTYVVGYNAPIKFVAKHQYIYIYIYKTLCERVWSFTMWHFCKENWNTFKYHIRDKNKWNIDLCFIWFNISRLFLIKKQRLFVYFGLIFQYFSSFAHTHEALCISIHHFHLLHFYSTLLYIPTHNLSCHPMPNIQIKNDVFYIQSFNNTYLAPILGFHLILTCMSRLQLGKGAHILYWVTVTINILMLRSDVVDLWVF